ncbi:translation elongation factor Ts [Enterobacteriaceae endosymbiont of Donacia tomentosa]|uniref:translation elongation factor Ts n=1 Tax=Enterobacteriaceae endosymbiont of Donacia tomentosa TaxID=2675787 RepID=UPI00145654CA|nr:translation elongation factor Ts [Enterobacteriaceae endosymbiont of Donacia tomentosa]
MKININKIKELRNITGVGILECKKALVATKGNINLAINYIRKYSQIESIKKSNNLTKEGIIISFVKKNIGILLEINCQTDFVAKSIHITNFAQNIIEYIFNYKITDIIKIKNVFEEEKIKLIGILKENISINRFSVIEGKFIGQYIHHSKRIGVLLQSNLDNQLLMKKIAMHIAMLKPRYIQEKNIPNNVLHEEYQLQKDIAKNNKKSKIIINKITKGRVQKFINNITLYNQKFLFDNNQTVSHFLKENDMEIFQFINFELGSKYN